MRIIEPLEEGNTYHIFNRGINGTNIFEEKRNYYFFLKKYDEYCSPVFETFAYSLLRNHFHLMVTVKKKVIVMRKDGKGEIELNASRQLSHFFNCYAQSFNKAYKRHGKLFEEPFSRKPVDSESYYTGLIYYVHFNPQHHQFVNDFREWPYSSYQAYISGKTGFLEKDKMREWFGTMKHFKEAHEGNMPINGIDHLIIE